MAPRPQGEILMQRATTLKSLRAMFIASTMLASPALAQEVPTAPAPVPAPEAPVEQAVEAPQAAEAPAAPASGQSDIVVTGSRITASGFTAPTPTQVLNADAIGKNAQPNVFTTVAQLPSGRTTRSRATSGISCTRERSTDLGCPARGRGRTCGHLA